MTGNKLRLQNNFPAPLNWGGTPLFTKLVRFLILRFWISFDFVTGGRWYTLRPQHAPNMAMDVYNASTANDANIWQYTYNGSDAQKFGFVKLSNGAYRIVTKVTGGLKNLSVNSISTEAGANIAQYEYVGGTNDHWFLERADQIAELTVFSLPSGGHSWITIKNNLGTNINCDIYIQFLPGKKYP